MFPNKSVRFLVCVIVMIMGSYPISSYASRASSPQIGKIEYVPGEILVKVKKVVSRKEKLEPSLKGRSGVLPKGRDILREPRDLKGFSVDILLKEHKLKALIWQRNYRFSGEIYRIDNCKHYFVSASDN